MESSLFYQQINYSSIRVNDHYSENVYLYNSLVFGKVFQSVITDH